MAFFGSLIHTVESFLFPDRCVSCRTDNTLLCLRCESSFVPVHERFEGITPVFEYSGAIKDALHALKYENKKRLGAHLGERAWHEIGPALFEEDAAALFSREKIILIPVPISHTRLRKRGYNQAAELAKGFAKESPESFELRLDVLYKIKDTESQVAVKDRSRRIKNIKDSFAVQAPNALSGRYCVVLDDITTTGATLGEAKLTLKKAGARKVVAVAIAH